MYPRLHPIMKEARHYQLAQKVLKEAEDLLTTRGWKTIRDSWPFHIVILTSRRKRISIYCSGFNSYLDLQLLTKKGSPDKRSQEKRFGGTKSLSNYLDRHWISDVERWYRADGQCICKYCGKEYRAHLEYKKWSTFHKLCSGDIVKT